MTEKDIWKWILENFSDEGLASIGVALDLKIPGFRQIHPKLKNFKILRPKLIQESLIPGNLTHLKEFLNKITEEKAEEIHYREKGLEELLTAVTEVEIAPTVLLTVLLTSEKEENIDHAIELYTKLFTEGTLEELEKQANEITVEEEETEIEDEKSLHYERMLKEAQQNLEAVEKKLKKSEQKNESLKGQISSIQTSFETEKKQWKEEKKYLNKEIQTLKSENGAHKNEANTAIIDRENMAKKLEQIEREIKKKDEEISRLHALILKLKTESQQGEQTVGDKREPQVLETELEEMSAPTTEGNQIKVAMIGDPKNTRVHQYNRFNLNIIEAAELEEDDIKELLYTADDIWLLTYRIPRGVQKRIKKMLEEKEIMEFATFVDLENYMKKG